MEKVVDIWIKNIPESGHTVDIRFDEICFAYIAPILAKYKHLYDGSLFIVIGQDMENINIRVNSRILFLKRDSVICVNMSDLYPLSAHKKLSLNTYDIF